MLQNLAQKKNGTVDMTVNGVSSTLYYGPIEGIDWTLMVVVPNDDIQKPILTVGIILLAIALLGIVAVWIVCRRIRYAEKV